MIPSNQRLGAVEGVASGATDRNSRSFFFRELRRVTWKTIGSGEKRGESNSTGGKRCVESFSV